MILNLHLPKLRILIASLLQMSKVVFMIFYYIRADFIELN